MLALLILTPVVLLAGFLVWASLGFDSDARADPPETGDVEVADPEGTPERLRVITYNIHHAAGPRGEFEPHSAADQTARLDRIAALLIEQDAHIVALQEVDFDASRSHGMDQLTYLADAAGYRYRARVTTWRKNYVPFPYWPPSMHIGRIHSGQAVMSRYPIITNERALLPQPAAQPSYKNAFYLHRAIQVAEVEVGEHTIAVLNCHFEAFFTANREDHARVLIEGIQADPKTHWIVLGDMNALPPEADQMDGFEDEPDWSGRADDTIRILREGLGSEELPRSLADGVSGAFTFPAFSPTRRLDYIFSSGTMSGESADVLTEASELSDHLPVAATLRLAPAAP